MSRQFYRRYRGAIYSMRCKISAYRKGRQIYSCRPCVNPISVTIQYTKHKLCYLFWSNAAFVEGNRPRISATALMMTEIETDCHEEPAIIEMTSKTR